MMPEEWPIAATAANANAPARASLGGRLGTVRQDFFLDPSARLSEQERALMTAMLHCLVREIADELRAALPPGWTVANDQGDLDLIERLNASGLLDIPELIALLLHRADEERISTAAKARSGHRDAQLLQGLVSHPNGQVSAAAMALILARGRRRDRFGQCLAAFDDLAPATAEELAQRIAAALRAELAASSAAAAVDRALANAASQVIGGHQPQRSLESLTAALVAALSEAEPSTDELILAAGIEGEVTFVAEMLARRAMIDSGSAFEEFLSGDAERLMALFRMAVVPRDIGAGLLAGIGDLLAVDDPGEAIGLFDRMSDADTQAARLWLLTAPPYRAALERLGDRRG